MTRVPACRVAPEIIAVSFVSGEVLVSISNHAANLPARRSGTDFNPSHAPAPNVELMFDETFERSCTVASRLSRPLGNYCYQAARTDELPFAFMVTVTLEFDHQL
jgi:hypothetical protein